MVSLGAELVLMAVLMWALSSIMFKRVAVALGNIKTGMFVIGAGLIPISIYAFYAGSAISLYAFALSIVSGLLFGVAALLYYKSVETQQISNTVAIGMIQPVLIFVFSILVLKEGMTLAEIVGGIVVLAGVGLVSMTAGLRFNRRLIPAFLGQAIWAFYWMALSLSIVSSSQAAMPLMISRIFAFLVVVLAYKVFIQKKAPRMRGFRTLAKHTSIFGTLSGILDGSGNLLYSNVVLFGALAVGAVIQLTLPLIVIALAWVFLSEKLTRVQAAGVLIAIAGAFILTV